MKKFFAGITALVLLLSLAFSAPVMAQAARPNVVTTIFPIYDWIREIVGDADSVDVTLLLDSGVDLHSYQPTAQDMMKIALCDLFAYVGGESDEWVEDALNTAPNPDRLSVSLLDALGDGAKAEEILEGMEAEAEEDDAEGEGVEYDEHVWLSLRNAQVLVRALSEALGRIDPERAERYAANAEAYIEKLAALDAAYADALGSADLDTLLFGDRFPFRYLADDYGLRCYAAFSGCSAESEASFETIAFLAGKVDELELPAVMTIEGTDHRVAETVVASTREKSARILTLDSMQGTTMADVESGATYLSAMEKNLEVLRQALTR